MTSDDKDKKGFGGFAGLLSDVSEEIKAAAQEPASEQAHEVTQTTHSTSHQTATPPRQPSPPPLPLDTPGGKSGFDSGWAWAGLVVFILIAIAANSGKKEEPTVPIAAPAHESSYEAPISSVDSAPVAEARVADFAPAEINDSEEMPPVGSGLVFTAHEIRYCLAEDVRLSTIKKAIDNYSQTEVNRFNAAIDDFNSRCSSYKYSRGTLGSIQDEVNSRHAPLVLEGLERLDSWRSETSSQSGITPPAADVQSVAVQQKVEPQSPSVVPTQPNLAELSTSARISIESACSAKYYEGPAAYNACLNKVLAKWANHPADPDRSGLSMSEQIEFNAVCTTAKYYEGLVAYNSCLSKELAKFPNAPAQADLSLSKLSTSQRISINLVCSNDKYYDGLVAYNGCLKSQMTKLANARAQPNLSEPSTSEQTSAESLCLSDKYTKGHAAYNACLARQLSQLR